MIQSVIEVASFLFLAIMGTPGGVGMIFMGALLLVFRWMLRDKDDNVRTATHS
jgi:di/tricarboxylate transporter